MLAVAAFLLPSAVRGQGAGDMEAPPPVRAVEAVESLIAEIGALRRALGVSDRYSGVEPQPNRTPAHVYAKTLEVFHKVRRLQAQFGLTPAPSQRMPLQPIELADAIGNLEYVVRQVRRIREQFGFDGGSEPTPVLADATLSAAYERLAVASLMLDGLRGSALLPDDLFQIASVAFADLEAIAERLNIALDVGPGAPSSPRPAEIARDLMLSIERAIDLQAKLGMVASAPPQFTPVRVTSSEIYDLTGLLVAELSRIAHRAGIDEAPPPVAEFRGKTLRDLYARVQQLRQGLEKFTDESIELALVRLDEEAKERARPRQDEPREAVADADEPADILAAADEPDVAAGDAEQAGAEDAPEPDAAAEAPAVAVAAADEPGAVADEAEQAGTEKASEPVADVAEPDADAVAEVAEEAAQAVADADENVVATPEEEVAADEAVQQALVGAADQEGPEEEAVEEPAAETASSANPPCVAVFLGDPSSLSAAYPRRARRNYGDASIAVQFQIDENGRIIDGSPQVMPELSSATREASFDLFAQAGIEAVEDWRFEFEEPENLLCEKRQTLSVRFNFVFDN